ncbi:MAG: hypothetical protein A3F54_02085 [Candidatus Kerfeldbacteria bacterium RIFCSPHIGHO2_12_FULL_48_17]|uniref:Type 4 fimbrial biogenesis protein PilX N-terminal domain-containing protein n=1 Tax=Candidatus Kerfeldbacteria bacterium RIFCSPHIGHO2_12_FULL_48_17 TaxID=1798542 RepID=A0A1G2AXJ5_9BACT|nr:MAG: hypothetical protein A3F54_02085 [Candidatus Kerfeldbacteria bacterium RIFCSPHIGHO2_12_FULL_48_17]
MRPRGSMLITVLIFSGIYVTILGALAILTQVQRITTLHETASLQSLFIAESGVDYYRWHLAHSPTDYVGDTGIHDYFDPYGDVIGQYNIQVTPPADGSSVITIRVTGWTTTYPDLQRIVEVSYGTKSLGQFSLLSDSNVWIGDKEELKGPMHANGGIRMDGQSNSTLTSAKETYICGPEHGCNNEEKPGIWGTGNNDKSWSFPVPGPDFASIAVDAAALEAQAADDGLLLNDSGNFGYRITFGNTGTFSVDTVTALQQPVVGYDGTQWVTESHSYKTTAAVVGLQNIPLPNNGLIYVKDRVWVEGTVKGFATVVAAEPPEEGADASIIIQNDLKYKDQNSARLSLIAQKDILIPLYSPDIMQIDGALVALNGHVFRYYYPNYNSQPYKTYAIRKKIQTYGTIITKGVWTWSWVSGDPASVVSGYQQTQSFYDTDLLFSPPPFFPTTGSFELISWDERLPGQ